MPRARDRASRSAARRRRRARDRRRHRQSIGWRYRFDRDAHAAADPPQPGHRALGAHSSATGRGGAREVLRDRALLPLRPGRRHPRVRTSSRSRASCSARRSICATCSGLLKLFAARDRARRRRSASRRATSRSPSRRSRLHVHHPELGWMELGRRRHLPARGDVAARRRRAGDRLGSRPRPHGDDRARHRRHPAALHHRPRIHAHRRPRRRPIGGAETHAHHPGPEVTISSRSWAARWKCRRLPASSKRPRAR